MELSSDENSTASGHDTLAPRQRKAGMVMSRFIRAGGTVKFGTELAFIRSPSGD
jgi:hypothetical protein